MTALDAAHDWPICRNCEPVIEDLFKLLLSIAASEVRTNTALAAQRDVLAGWLSAHRSAVHG